MATLHIHSIYELRNTVNPVAGDIYYSNDLGQEGEWYYDSNDTTSPDNTGIILEGQSGVRFKRIYNGFVNVKWFGAKGDAWPGNDSITNDTVAIQLALDTMILLISGINSPHAQNQTVSEMSGALYFPAGYYQIETVEIRATDFVSEQYRLRIIGAGIKSTIFVHLSQYIPAPPGAEASASIPINVVPLFLHFQSYITIEDLSIIGNFISEGIYSIQNTDVGGPYYYVGAGYECIGINAQDNVACSYRKLYIACCEVCFKSYGCLIYNISECTFGNDDGRGDYSGSEGHITYSPEFASNYGLSIKARYGGDAANLINISNCRIVRCRIWGLEYGDQIEGAAGDLLNITGSEFEANGSQDLNGVGDPETGGIIIWGYSVNPLNDGTPLQVNIYNSHFERNYGYFFKYDGLGNRIFNILGSLFSGADQNKRYFGILIDTHPGQNTTYVEVKIVNIMGCNSNISALHSGGGTYDTFIINCEEANLIGSYLQYLSVYPASTITQLVNKL